MATLQERLKARFKRGATPGGSAAERLRNADFRAGPTAPPAGPGGAPVAPGKEGGRPPAQGLRQALTSKIGQGAMKLLKGAGKLAAPVAVGSAGVSALRSYNTPTDVYAKRYGEQAGEGFVKDLGIRARGVGEDVVNTLNPFSNDTFGTGADKPISPIRAKVAPVDTLGERMKANAATYAEGTEKPLGQTTPDTGLRSRIVQDGPNSFNDGLQTPPDIGKRGGGLSVVGSITPERVQAISQANAELQEAREAASIGISTEQYQRQKARRANDSEIAGLTQNGLGLREATARVFDRNAAADVEAARGAGEGGLSASDQISLASLMQRTDNQEQSLGLRRQQFGLNEEQAADQKTAAERNAANKYIDGLNSEDPGVASATRGQVVQKAIADPTSAEGQLAFSQVTEQLRKRAGEERGVVDELASILPGGEVPNYNAIATGDFTLEEGVLGEGLHGTLIKDANGTVLGNLDDQDPEYAQFIRAVYKAKQQNQGLRR